MKNNRKTAILTKIVSRASDRFVTLRVVANPKVKLFAVIFLIFIIFSGCAFVDQSVRLSYEPVGAMQTRTQSEVGVYPVNDSRPDKKVIGVVRNLRGDKTADTVLDEGQDVSGWVTDAIISELEQAGFRVSKLQISSWSGTIVSGDVSSIIFDTSPDFYYQANLIINVEARNGETIILKKTYEGNGKAYAKWGTDEERDTAMKAALQDAVSQFVHDFIEQS